MDSISEMAFRGCDSLDTVYYDGSSRTAQEIDQIISDDVPAFESTGNVTSGNLTGTVISGNATENADGTITQQNTTVKRGENATVSTIVTNTHPEDSLSGEITADIVITVEGEDGWKEASDTLQDALKSVNETASSLGSTGNPANVTIYVKNTQVIDQNLIDNLAGRDVIVTIVTEDGSVWRFKGLDLETQTGAESYDLRFEVLAGTEELCEALKTEKCYVLRFEAPAQINAELLIRLDPQLAGQNATLFQAGDVPARIQTTVIDNDGFAHFYLASVSSNVEYYIALNLQDADQDLVVPAEVQEAYGINEIVEPIKYEITGVKSSWGMTFKQVTWIMVAVLVGCVVVVGVVMMALNKRKLRMGYIPNLEDEDYE